MEFTANQRRLLDQLTLDEGRKKKPYRDTVGKITIGVGRNLTDRGLSDDEIDYLLINDIKIVEDDLDRNLPWWRSMDDIRQRVIIDLCFNMGISTLLEFHNTLGAMKAGNYNQAATGLEHSAWFKEVGLRGPRLVGMLRTGKDYQ